MSKDSSKHNEFGPDHMGYYKYVLLELFSREDDLISTVMSSAACSRGDSRQVQCVQTGDNNKKVQSSWDPSLFTEGIGYGLTEYKKEGLMTILLEAATFLDEETDKILDQTLATLEIASDQRDRPVASYGSGSDEGMPALLCGKKRKAPPLPALNRSGNGHGLPSSESLEQVCRDILAIGNGKIHQEAVEKYSAGLLAKLDKMAQDIDQLLNEVASKCRPMTTAEKHQLGKLIRKIPEKALHRVVEILENRKSSARQTPDKLHVNLLEEDDITLWRLYYYVENVLKANKI